MHPHKIFEQRENKISSAFFKFVAINDNEEAIKVFPITPITAIDKIFYEDALKRKLK